jgi:Leucine-rich repeat (LRR) protein
MKNKYFFLALFMCLAQLISAQIVNIPDAIFKASLVNGNIVDTNDDGIGDVDVDTNNDGEIQVSEAEAIDNLLFSGGQIVSLVGIEAFVNLERIDCSYNNINESLDFSTMPNLKFLNCSYNQIQGLNVASNLNLEVVYCNSNSIPTLDVSLSPNLLFLNAAGNVLSNLNFHSNLEELIVGDNALSSIDVSSNTNLRTLHISNNMISSIDVSQNPNLEILRVEFNMISSLDVTSNPNLTFLHFRSNTITSIDVTMCPNLEFLSTDNNILTTLDVSGCPNLKTLSCEGSQITHLDLSANVNLEDLFCRFNLLTSLDVSQSPNLNRLSCAVNQLTSLSIKNGSTISGNNLNFAANPDLVYICVDDDEFQQVQALLTLYNQPNVTVNSYCSFTPGGTFYTVSGDVTLDADSNGCDMTDAAFPNIEFSITNGIETGTFTANASGSYEIPLGEGIHTITPQLENPSYFTVSPTSIMVDFPTDASPTIQDFCITPNGSFNDLEVTIIPLEEARPGFDTDYKIIYKNKGTTTLSGTVNLMYNDDYMNLVSASLVADTQSTGSLTWNYTNLAPFETRSILYTMNLNTPTDMTFPLNGGDELTFTGMITPSASDETPDDNAMILEQIVVNSFDPNDKTCLEGDKITTDKVGEFVHYLIRFENTGTASAINVVVKDEIDVASYDVSSLTVLDGSHDFVTKVEGQTVEFIFENINLPFDDATNDGYVLFKIKTLSTLMENDTFMNKAEIYFDYNAPIITNDEITTVMAPLSIAETNLDGTVEAFPKPTKETLYIQGENPIKSIELYSLQGRLMLSKKFIGNQTSVDISVKTLSNGLYIVKATSEKGVFIDKIIKQ